MALFRNLVRYGMRPAIRLIKGGANQKVTQGMIRGAGSTSKGGVETMGSMGTMPSKLGQIPKVKPAKGKVETMKTIYRK